jgi:hypothetical protein
VALWLVIDPCVNFGRVYCDFFGIHILFLNFLRHQTMDKVQKYNSFNTNTPSSESYRNYLYKVMVTSIQAVTKAGMTTSIKELLQTVVEASKQTVLYKVLEASTTAEL